MTRSTSPIPSGLEPADLHAASDCVNRAAPNLEAAEPSSAVTAVRLGYHVTDDVPGLAAFYRDALGLQQRFLDGSRWAEFQAGDSRFALACPEEAPTEAGGAVLVFACDDLPALRSRLREHGGRVLAERDMGSHGRTLTAMDPAGNIFQLYSR